MKNFKFKATLLAVVFAISQLVVNAEPGVLDFVFKSSNGLVQETITIDNQVGDVVAILIFNRKNQLVYQAKYSIGQSTKVFCEQPKGFYRIVIANINDQARGKAYRINLE